MLETDKIDIEPNLNFSTSKDHILKFNITYQLKRVKDRDEYYANIVTGLCFSFIILIKIKAPMLMLQNIINYDVIIVIKLL